MLKNNRLYAKIPCYFILLLLTLINTNETTVLASELQNNDNEKYHENNSLLVGKTCPVSWQQTQLGLLAFSKAWYHSGGMQASYQAKDDATGVGIEIHFLASKSGHIRNQNSAKCQRYRIVQTRNSNANHHDNKAAMQLDIPQYFELPFYDNQPLEFGRGTHFTPKDSQDKPWSVQHSRASSVAIYDTPYISDRYGKEGESIKVKFETCVICQRDTGYDLLLSCGNWGFEREYIDTMTGWSEPEFIPVQCQSQASSEYKFTLDSDTKIDYQYWLDWR